jgi:DNA topoisomerase VI subunit B
MGWPPRRTSALGHSSSQPGKSLYTTLRELIENGLDAAEAIMRLPDLAITV